MSLVYALAEAWGWQGVEPTEVVNVNSFGNVIFLDKAGQYWRLCPEELNCIPVASSATEYEALLHDGEFIDDWAMSGLTEVAERQHGSQAADRCFCFKVPPVLGGDYDLPNIGTIGIHELIRFSGDIAHQIKDLPEGAQVQLKVVE